MPSREFVHCHLSLNESFNQNPRKLRAKKMIWFIPTPLLKETKKKKKKEVGGAV